MGEKLPELCPTVVFKTTFVRNEPGYLAEEISKRGILVQVGFFLLIYSKMKEENDKLRKELLSKKEPALDNLGNSQLF